MLRTVETKILQSAVYGCAFYLMELVMTVRVVRKMKVERKNQRMQMRLSLKQSKERRKSPEQKSS